MPPPCRGRCWAQRSGGAVGNYRIFNQAWFVTIFLSYHTWYFCCSQYDRKIVTNSEFGSRLFSLQQPFHRLRRSPSPYTGEADTFRTCIINVILNWILSKSDLGRYIASFTESFYAPIFQHVPPSIVVFAKSRYVFRHNDKNRWAKLT